MNGKRVKKLRRWAVIEFTALKSSKKKLTTFKNFFKFIKKVYTKGELQYA